MLRESFTKTSGCCWRTGRDVRRRRPRRQEGADQRNGKNEGNDQTGQP